MQSAQQNKTIGSFMLVWIALFLIIVSPKAISADWHSGYDFSSKGVIGYWPMDSSADDISGNGLNGTAYNTTAGTGQFDACYDFNGVTGGSGSRIELPQHAHTTGYSVSCWVYIDSFPAYSYPDRGSMVIYNRRQDYADIFLDISLANGTDPDGKISFSHLRGSGVQTNAAQTETAVVSAGQWYHIVGTMDENWTRIYLDGVLVAEEASAGSMYWDGAYMGTFIGCNGSLPEALYRSNFNGLIDEFILFDRALDPTEVVALGQDNDSNGQSDLWQIFSMEWTEFVGSTPSARTDHAMVFDPDRNVIVLYGGTDTSSKNDTWEFDGTSWTNVSPTPNPGNDSQHNLAYDKNRQVVVYVGDSTPSTWEYDGSAQTWTPRDVTPAPSSTSAMGLVYMDSLGKVILYGGADDLGGQYHETWAWDGVSWEQIVTATQPTPFSRFGMAYDSRRGCIVLQGGFTDASEASSETWEFNGSDWAKVTTSQAPPAGESTAMAYDSGLGAMVLCTGGTFGNYHNNTWIYDGNDWNLASTDNQPSARYEAKMVYDDQNDQLVFFGGYPPHLGDTWLGHSPASFPVITPTSEISVTSIIQNDQKKIVVEYSLTPHEPAPAGGYSIRLLALDTMMSCEDTAALLDTDFDDVTAHVTGDTTLTSGTGTLTWDVGAMSPGALRDKYWVANTYVLFRVVADPIN